MPPNKKKTTTNGKNLSNQKSVNDAVKSICDIMRRGNVTSAVQYVPELTWILFLRVLDEIEQEAQEETEALGLTYTPPLAEPYRWRDWAAPDGEKRGQLEDSYSGAVFAFVNARLIPYLKGLEKRLDATVRQKVISEIMSGVERVKVDTERNFLDILDRVHQLSHHAIDKTHVFSLSQVYEGLLLKMGEKNNDGGQFFTPRQVIRAMVRAIDPKIGETIYDPGSGTGGFLAQSYEHIKAAIDQGGASAEQYTTLKEYTFYGREKENLIYPIALANLVLHGIDHPHIWHGNTLTGKESYGGLFVGAPDQFDIVLTNPPFGGKEGKDAQTCFDYKTSSTQVLYLQHVIGSLKAGGRCGMVVDEGLLFRANEDAFVKTKRKLLDDCNLWCVVSLPGGVFTQAGAGVKTNLLFFTKGEPTQAIWYYDLSDLKIAKKKPLTLEHFADFLKRLPDRSDSDASWTVDMVARKRKAAAEARPFHEQAREKKQEAARWKERLDELRKPKSVERDDAAIEEADNKIKELTKEANALTAKAADIENAVYDLKAVNPNRTSDTDTRTPEELLAIIEAKGKEIEAALALLRSPMTVGC
ncbi:MAG: N-6 DNA methylase [Gammaproteobacteria bacterium]|nr:N-6 DNA methylase [Candidatus Competibacteraceae bacterium]MCP5421254.1 N-6 DNA methylase [Gammaproteobacteria bacterium]